VSRRKRAFSDRLISSLLYVINLFLAYALMLVVMSGNMGLILAIVLGMGLGYFLFQTDVDEEPEPECCEK